MAVWLLLVVSVGAEPAFERLVADPPAVQLEGADASLRVLVHGETGDGRAVDLTGQATYRLRDARVASVSAEGLVRPQGDGATVVEIAAAGRQVEVPVRVERADQRRPVNFENDVVPVLTRFGCNASGCHGKAEGQNGFKLSVFGSDADADYQALIMEGRGRRVFPAAPQRSLLLQKASGGMPHGGGVRIVREQPEYQILHDWIAGGLPRASDDAPKLERIEVTPASRRLAMGQTQQLRVVARTSDGRQVDVTSLAQFQSNQEALATVDQAGRVTAGQAPGTVAVMASYQGQVAVFETLIPRSETVQPDRELEANHFIDQLVYGRLRQLNIVPSEPASDAQFLRRVYLDLIGTLPTSEEARRFLADDRPDRRGRLVDRLLQRDELADYWALKWSDVLRVDRQVLGHKAAYEQYRWIRQSLAEGLPLDQFARQILTAEGPLSESPQGNLFKVAAQPGEAAALVSQVFLGVRIECAQCHHHPFDRWSQTDYFGMQAFFTPLKRKPSPWGELLLAEGNPVTRHPRTGEPVFAHPLGTAMPEENPPGDRRRELAEWLTGADNPWFARNLANRVWAHLLGRGLVEPVDDVRATNPPSNPELLDALAAHLAESGYDLRALLRTITASRVYQQSSEPNRSNADDRQNFSRALLKRPGAEVLLDAVCQVTGVPEKFDGVAASPRAIQLWDSQVQHDFLRLFGRPVRKSACECERNVEPSVAQVLHLLNSERVQAKLTHEAGTVARLVRSMEDEPLVDELYLTFYSRYPSRQERQGAVQYLQSGGDRRRAAEDLAWTLLNSLEFLFNH